MYCVFVRDWWKEGGSQWPNGLEPFPDAPRKYLAKDVATEEEARSIAREYNRTHDPGRYSRKAEFDVQ